MDPLKGHGNGKKKMRWEEKKIISMLLRSAEKLIKLLWMEILCFSGLQPNTKGNAVDLRENTNILQENAKFIGKCNTFE